MVAFPLAHILAFAQAARKEASTIQFPRTIAKITYEIGDEEANKGGREKWKFRNLGGRFCFALRVLLGRLPSTKWVQLEGICVSL